jgi:uncharacterized membrane protein YdjX (TVP38/TMEM64 family)
VTLTLLVALRVSGPELLSRERLSEWLGPLGDAAPLAFVLLLAVRPLTLLPGQAFAAVGGMLFGTVAGTLYTLAGSLLSSGVVFLVARRFGRRAVRKLSGSRHRVLSGVARERGFLFGVFACINSVLPADVLLATASAAGARFLPLALGALVGTVPGTLLTVFFGNALARGDEWASAASAAGLVGSIVVGLLLGRRLLHTWSEQRRAQPRASRPPAAPGRLRPDGQVAASS